MAQFAPPPMGPRRAQSISDLIMHQGDVAARGAANSGAIWGGVARDLGQIAGGAIQQHQERKSQEQRSQGINAAIQGWDGKDLPGLYRGLAPFMDSQEAIKTVTAFGTLQNTMRELQEGRTPSPEDTKAQIQGIVALEKGDPGYIERNYAQIAPLLGPGASAHFGWQPAEQWDPSVTQGAQALSQSWEGTRAVTTTNPDGSKTEQIVPDVPGQTFESAVPPPPPRVPLGTIEAEAAADARGRAAGSPPPGPGEGSYVLDRDAEPGTDPHVMRTPEQVAAEPDRYGRPLFAAPTDELRRVETNLFAFKDIQSALEPVLDKIGPVEFTLRELQQKAPVLESDPAFRAFQQMVNALTNEEIRRITGAQMSASEATRLKKGMADGTLRLPELREALYLWQRGMERARAGLMGNLKRWEEKNPYEPTYFQGDSQPKEIDEEALFKKHGEQ